MNFTIPEGFELSSLHVHRVKGGVMYLAHMKRPGWHYSKGAWGFDVQSAVDKACTIVAEWERDIAVPSKLSGINLNLEGLI